MYRIPGVICVQLCTAVRSVPLNFSYEAHLLISNWLSQVQTSLALNALDSHFVLLSISGYYD